MANKKWIFFFFILISSCTTSRIIFYNYASIEDYKIFDTRVIENGNSVFHFPRHPADLNFPFQALTIHHRGIQKKMFSFLKDTDTIAFLFLKNDQLLFEKYLNEYTKEKNVASFSIAKSIISLLIGIAIQEGKIQSIYQPITDFLPHLLDRDKYSDIKIYHLLQMTSGIQFDEEYWWLGDAAEFYYTTDLKSVTSQLEIGNLSGAETQYKSVDTQLLGMILAQATKMSNSQYLQEKIWIPLGMEAPALWGLDSQHSGIEKAFCCIYARAIDFAKIGSLYLNNGNWKGEQIISEKWIKQSTMIDSTNGSVPYYQHQWWIHHHAPKTYAAEGFLGQFIYISPSTNTTILRFGKNSGGINWYQYFRFLDQKVHNFFSNKITKKSN